MDTRQIQCPHCSQPTRVGVPPARGTPRRMVTQCPYCAYDLVVSQGTAGKPVIRACLRWATTCPYCQQATIARAPPKGVLRRKEITPCRHCAQPLIVERREEGRLVLRAHRSVLKGGVL